MSSIPVMATNEVLIVGTVALDSVKTPFGHVQNALGGSASYASTACSFFSPARIISIVGEDFPPEHLAFLQSRGIDTSGIKKEGKTFHWEGFYEFDMNEAKTIRTELNSLATFAIGMPPSYRDAKYLFLANIDPKLQMDVLDAVNAPHLVVMDTMNFWISSRKRELLEVIRRVDVLVLNDGEARQLFGTVSLLKAARQALSLGPEAVIIKKGEHGALLFTDDRHFSAPGYPLEEVKDPTGCGDCFGGGLVGYLAKEGKHDEKTLRKAIVYGSVLASYNAEDFSLNRLRTLKSGDIEGRYREMKDIREF